MSFTRPILRLSLPEAELLSNSFYQGFYTSKATTTHGKLLDGLTHAFYIQDHADQLAEHVKERIDLLLLEQSEGRATGGRRIPLVTQERELSFPSEEGDF